jgi:RNA polymerase sigma-70 factor (ECF subfamily)
MEQVQAGDLDRFVLLIRRYQRPLIRAALDRLGDRDWADDIVQETFLAAYAARASYNPSFSFRTWIWTILINLCKRQWKRKALRPSLLPLSDWIASDRGQANHPEIPSTAHGCLVQTEQVDRVRSLLAQLPEDQADALRLRFFGDLTFPEIAVAMGCSLNTAKSRVRYGLEKLGRALRTAEDEIQ